ncbi:hypothetical protein ACM66B_000459 [Microbotryomycetes sp. NB124-2]
MPARRAVAALLVAAVVPSLVDAALSSNAAQLYLSPAPAGSYDTIELTAPQANAVLAHHLGASQYEPLPVSKGDARWQRLLAPSQSASDDGPRVAVILECPTAQACADVVPEQFETAVAELPSLPHHSWISAVTLHLHRLTSALGIDKNSHVVYGLDSLSNGLKSLDGWAGWVGDELGSRIGWDKLKQKYKAAVEPVSDDMGMLTDASLLDESANELVFELQQMAKLVDSLQQSQQDNGPQSERPQVVALHIKGLDKVANAHSTSSDMYERAASLVRQTLSATMNALEQNAGDDRPTFVLLALPPYKQPWLVRRSNWLHPFQASSASYVRVARPRLARSMTRSKRSTVFSPRADAADRTPSPVVPQSRRCFSSEKELKNLTASCLGRGQAVKGVTTRKLDKGGECWVCSCGKTMDKSGKVHKWAGEGCEKEDLSSDFVLLFFSGLGLVLILVASIVLLYGIGNVELPGTLSSVSGAGAGHKRD